MQDKITLKNIKYAAFSSEETHCYEATVYFENKRAGIVKNDGHGGADYEYPENRDVWKAMQQYIGTLPDVETDMRDPHDPDKMFTYGQSLENICHNLVNDFLTTRDLKRLLKRKFVWQRDDGGVYECKRRPEHTVEAMQDVIAKTEPTAKLLNAMPFDKALEIYRSI